MSGLLLLNAFPKCHLGPYWNSDQPGEDYKQTGFLRDSDIYFGLAASAA